jgi:hypothetical protein
MGRMATMAWTVGMVSTVRTAPMGSRGLMDKMGQMDRMASTVTPVRLAPASSEI